MTTYNSGNVCGKCGNDERYNLNDTCVTCARERAKRFLENKPWLDNIEESDSIVFDGEPCIKCGNIERYKNSGSCVVCISERKKANGKNKPWINDNTVFNDDGLTYLGKECSSCGNIERLISNNMCRACKNTGETLRKLNRPWMNKSIEIQDEIYYIRNTECKTCNTNLFYIKSGDCAQCSKNRGNNIYLNKTWLETEVVEYIDDIFFRSSKICKSCGDDYRYIVSGTCRTCERDKAIIREHNKRIVLDDKGSFTTNEWLEMCEYYDYTCLSCGEKFDISKLERDHVVPISRGGYNTIINLQVLCKHCNVSKFTKIIDFREIGDDYRGYQNIR